MPARRWCDLCRAFVEQPHAHEAAPPSLFDAIPTTLPGTRRTAPGLDRPARELRRNDGPATSEAAAASLDAKAHRARLLTAYQSGPHTYEEAAALAGLNPWQSTKRTTDLLALDLIEPTGETRPGTSGRQQRIYRATEKGRTA